MHGVMHYFHLNNGGSLYDFVVLEIILLNVCALKNKRELLRQLDPTDSNPWFSSIALVNIFFFFIYHHSDDNATGHRTHIFPFPRLDELKYAAK